MYVSCDLLVSVFLYLTLLSNALHAEFSQRLFATMAESTQHVPCL